MCDIKPKAGKVVEENLSFVTLGVPPVIIEHERKNSAVMPIVVVGHHFLLPELPAGLMRCRDVVAVCENDIGGSGRP